MPAQERSTLRCAGAPQHIMETSSKEVEEVLRLANAWLIAAWPTTIFLHASDCYCCYRCSRLDHVFSAENYPHLCLTAAAAANAPTAQLTHETSQRSHLPPRTPQQSPFRHKPSNGIRCWGSLAARSSNHCLPHPLLSHHPLPPPRGRVGQRNFQPLRSAITPLSSRPYLVGVCRPNSFVITVATPIAPHPLEYTTPR